MKGYWAVTFGGKAGHTDYLPLATAETVEEAEKHWRRQNPPLRFLPVKVKKVREKKK